MTPPPLVLHVGMPKTGTSSIQESLFHGLTDRRFRYIDFGLVNGSRAIQCLVGDEPVVAHLHPAQGIDREALGQRRPRFEAAWERQVARARRAGAIPVVSAEDCWFLARPEWERLAAMIEASGHRAQVVAYLRPPLAWLGSMFQELLKSGHHAFVDELLIGDGRAATIVGTFGCDYLYRIKMIEEVFGPGSLTVRLFRPDALAGGCVVADFCRQVGIAMPRRRVRRVNESLGLDATGFLLAYNRFARSRSRRSFRDFRLLLERLQECPVRPLRLHPDLLAPVRPLLESQVAILNERHGIDLREDWADADRDAVRHEEDLWRFSPAALDWLGAATGGALERGPDGSAAAAEVGARVERIEPRFVRRLGDIVSRRLRQWRLRRAEGSPTTTSPPSTPQLPVAPDRQGGRAS